MVEALLHLALNLIRFDKVAQAQEYKRDPVGKVDLATGLQKARLVLIID